MRSSVLSLLAILLVGGAWAAAESQDDFPEPRNTERDTAAAPMNAEDAAAGMILPEGFRAVVFAAEPDVQNPIAMSWDGRGRLWVAENYTYAERTQRFDLSLRDRVVILEDTNGDGRSDRRTVFTDEVQMLTGLAHGHGGVWLLCPPRLLFVPDRDGDDRPDGPVEVVLDGFTVATENYHNFANGLKWGPDGWLYGRCGGSCPGRIGRPESHDDERIPLAGGIWRYHPKHRTVEVLATGTTNPWGHDWNAQGEAFFVNTVNGHLWHMIPGSHLDRLHSVDPNPHVYKLLDQHADHWHFDTGKGWVESRDGAANSLGGGHAHSGTMIYLGDNWPEDFRGRLYTLNFHGRRVNQEILERSGNGYVGRHGTDMLISPDPFFRGIDLDYGPDGGVYILDWSDTGECHENTGVHRTSGRIYKVVYGEPEPREFGDLRDKSAADLVELHTAPNAWFARQAQLVLTERAWAGESLGDAESLLRARFAEAAEPEITLRALQALHLVGGTDTAFLREQLRHPDEAIRAWALRLLTDSWPLDGPLGPTAQPADRLSRVEREAAELTGDLENLARSDSSGLVRLTLASILQRLPVAHRAALAAALVSRSEDADDPNLPLMVWYGLIPVADADPVQLVDVARACRWPLTRRFLARRLAEDIETKPAAIHQLLALIPPSTSSEFQRDLLDGLSEALRGWRKATPPANWSQVRDALDEASDPDLVERVRELSVVFGDGRALDEVRRLALDPNAPRDTRRSALSTLIENRPDDLRGICETLVQETFINDVAAKGLALFDDPAAAETLVNAYRRFRAPDRPQMISLLATRPTFARALLSAIASGRIPREDLGAIHVRQILSLGDASLEEALAQVWGTLRESPEDRKRLIASLRVRLTDENLAGADKSQGRLVYDKVCAQCHRLYGEGATIGPDLTGSGRHNLDYLLENIIDPSAVVNADYRMTVFLLDDGRVLSGVVTAQTDRTITLQALTEQVTIDRGQVEEMRATDQSPMPEGLLEPLDESQIRDLIAYLRHPAQVPRPIEKGDASAESIHPDTTSDGF